MEPIVVIVPVYNGQDYLVECIDSLRAQTYRDFAVLFVDDGSTDDSPKMLDEAAAADPRFHVLHKANEGLMATWIRGVRETEEPYIMFLDCDDTLDTRTLEVMAGQLSYPSDPSVEDYEIISSNFVIDRCGENGEVSSEVCTSRAIPGDYTGLYLKRNIKDDLLGNEQRTMILSRCMKLFSRKLLTDNLSYCNPKIRMGEDVNITVPAILDAKRVVLLPDAFYHYRFVQGSMVHSYDPKLYDNVKLLRSILLKVMQDKNVDNGKEMAEREVLYLLFLVMKNELRRTGCESSEVVLRVQEICHEQNAALRISKQKAFPKDNANRILEFMMMLPAKPVILAARALFLKKG